DLGRGIGGLGRFCIVRVHGSRRRVRGAVAADRLGAGAGALGGDLDPGPAKRANPPPSGLKFLDVQLVSVGTEEAYTHRCDILPQKSIITRRGCVGSWSRSIG